MQQHAIVILLEGKKKKKSVKRSQNRHLTTNGLENIDQINKLTAAKNRKMI